MKLRQRQLSAPKPISAAALRQRLYARPGLFAPAARLTRDDVGQNFRPRIHSRATSLPLFLSICYASLPPPPISRYLCSASIALLRSPLLSSSSSPLLPSRKTVRLTKPGSRKLRGDNVGTTFLRVSSARGGKKRTSFSSRAHPWLGQTNFFPLPPSLSLSLGLFQIKIARSSNGISERSEENRGGSGYWLEESVRRKGRVHCSTRVPITNPFGRRHRPTPCYQPLPG